MDQGIDLLSDPFINGGHSELRYIIDDDFVLGAYVRSSGGLGIALDIDDSGWTILNEASENTLADNLDRALEIARTVNP